MTAEDSDQLHNNVANIIASYVGNVGNAPVAAEKLPELIREVKAALSNGGASNHSQAAEPLTPAVPIDKSYTKDIMHCLDCGKSYKSLKRHLLIDHQLTPEQYRARWHLPAEYPMVAPSYAKRRAEIAAEMGLGHTTRGNKQTAKRAKR